MNLDDPMVPPMPVLTNHLILEQKLKKPIYPIYSNFFQKIKIFHSRWKLVILKLHHLPHFPMQWQQNEQLQQHLLKVY